MPQWLPILSWGSFILDLATAAVIAIDGLFMIVIRYSIASPK
jgi:hypothetical protein